MRANHFTVVEAWQNQKALDDHAAAAHTRQYRDDQACGDGYQDCADAADPGRSLPGTAQEAWLADGFRQSTARWDLLGQQKQQNWSKHGQ